MQVSAGYDAHWRDPLAGLQFRTSTFHYLAAQVKNLANAVAGKSATVVAQLVTHACSLVLRTYTVPVKTDSFLRIYKPVSLHLDSGLVPVSLMSCRYFHLRLAATFTLVSFASAETLCYMQGADVYFCWKEVMT